MPTGDLDPRVQIPASPQSASSSQSQSWETLAQSRYTGIYTHCRAMTRNKHLVLAAKCFWSLIWSESHFFSHSAAFILALNSCSARRMSSSPPPSSDVPWWVGSDPSMIGFSVTTRLRMWLLFSIIRSYLVLILCHSCLHAPFKPLIVH